jgi:hypothetical protein
MKHLFFHTPFLLTILSGFLIGCISWEPGWKMPQAPSAKGDAKALIAKAEKLESEANTKEKVRELIAAWEAVLAADPSSATALISLGRNCFLMAYGWGTGAKDKAPWYVKSIRYSERLLYLNKGFRAKVDGGARLWEALDTLTRDDMFGLMWWYLSLGSYWRECPGKPAQLANIHWARRMNMVLKRMMAIDPAWYHGFPYYGRATFYCGAPKIAGGDLQKADAMFKKAIENGPTMLNFRRTRARLLHTRTGDRAAFTSDMEWVIAQDPHRCPLGYPLNFFIQRDAREGLRDINKYFK